MAGWLAGCLVGDGKPSYPFNVGLSLLYDIEVKGQSRLTELGQRGFESLVACSSAVRVRRPAAVRGTESRQNAMH